MSGMKVRRSRRTNDPISISYKHGDKFHTHAIARKPYESEQEAIARAKAEVRRIQEVPPEDYDDPAMGPTSRDPTVEEWARWWFKARYERGMLGKVEARGATKEGVRSSLRKHVLPVLGRRKMRALHPIDLTKWRDSLGGLAASTKNKIIISCKAMFADAERLEYIRRSPAEHLAMMEVISEPRTSIGIEEFGRFLAAAKGLDTRPNMALMLFGGNRMSETRHAEARYMEILDDRLTISFHARVLKEKRGKKVSYPLGVMKYLRLDGSHYLASRASVRTIARHVAIVAEKAGMDGVTPHCLRHSAAQALEELGMPVSDISRQLGHSSIQTTYRYLKGRGERERKADPALEAMDNWVRGLV